MPWAKVNFTDVRISAMEDFVGRGDRRLAAVVKRAWELGAGMDAWWESLDKAYSAWAQAIDEAGLSWQYRRVTQGEWHLMSPGHQADAGILAAPLPWDHLDTGIDKAWLQEDLRRALEAATVPDCSFEGCSHCGVCGQDFGHNIVVQPPPIPAFVGHGQPDSQRLQRLRVTLGKLGTMALIGHLDLVRLFDRALRRAGLPISFTGGYHPGPRIAPANALPLGATSSGEVVDFELKAIVDPADFRQRLAAQLPADIPIYDVVEVPLSHPSATKSLVQAEYVLRLGLEPAFPQSPQWPTWIEAVKGMDELLWEKTTKSGRVKTVNLRQWLYQLELDPGADSDLPPVAAAGPRAEDVTIRFTGSCRNDGTLLKPEQVAWMLEQAAQQPIGIKQVHRQRLVFQS